VFNLPTTIQNRLMLAVEKGWKLRVEPKICGCSNEKSQAPLAGVRVLEFGHFAVGPYATMLLGDWGADVVKIEPPDGEPMRHWPPLVEDSDAASYGMNFAALNRNKRSVTLDLKDPKGIEHARKLCARADIVLENYRPGVMERLGLGYQDLLKLNPRIVYCSVSGYGHSGPLRDKGAFDLAIQGASGIMSVTGEEEGPPTKCGVPIADYGTGVFAAMSCVVALRRAEKENLPARLDVSMQSCMLSLSNLQTSEYWGGNTVPKRLGSRHPHAAPYQAYRGSDGKWFILAAGSDRLWERVCSVINRPELISDARFALAAKRAGNQIELGQVLQQVFDSESAGYWIEAFDKAEVPASPIHDYAEALNSDHVKEIGLIHSITLPSGKRFPTVGNPVSLSGYQFEVRVSPANAGEHNCAVSREWLNKSDSGE
jgi:crotonobetainyl-CoA:carnitine CoA-transferase CaiB-like acyl-CoA transferase